MSGFIGPTKVVPWLQCNKFQSIQTSMQATDDSMHLRFLGESQQAFPQGGTGRPDRVTASHAGNGNLTCYFPALFPFD